MANEFVDIVVLTSQTVDPNLSDDESFLSALHDESVRFRHQNWETYDPSSDREASVIFRTTWGYAQDLERFKKLLKAIDRSKILCWNPVSLIRWNLHKKYLNQLRKKGFSVVPTILLEPQELLDLQALGSQLECESFVVKPAVGAGGYNTFHIGLGDSLEPARKTLQKYREQQILAQPFISSIIEEGEYSLIFIEGEYTHCIQKKPEAGEFRVQPQHGGQIDIVPPPRGCIELGKKILSALHEEAMIARVDLVRTSKKHFSLMELELIEPNLWFSLERKSAERGPHALSKRL